MKWKKFIIAFIIAFVFLFVFGFLWYGMLMHGAHQQVATLFRAEPRYHALILGHLVMAFFLTLLCARFVPAGGLGMCSVLGVLLFVVFAGAVLISFAVLLVTRVIIIGWVFV